MTSLPGQHCRDSAGEALARCVPRRVSFVSQEIAPDFQQPFRSCRNIFRLRGKSPARRAKTISLKCAARDVRDLEQHLRLKKQIAQSPRFSSREAVFIHRAKTAARRRYGTCK